MLIIAHASVHLFIAKSLFHTQYKYIHTYVLRVALKLHLEKWQHAFKNKALKLMIGTVAVKNVDSRLLCP